MARAVLITVQYICIFGLFIESYIIFKKMTAPIHKYLFFSSLATLVTNVGYLMSMHSYNMDGYLIGVEASYLGKVWIPLAMALFAMELCNFRPPKILVNVMTLIHAATFFIVMTNRYHCLYYKDVKYVEEGIFSHIEYGDGPWHHVYMTLIIIYPIVVLAMMFVGFRKEKSNENRKRIIMVILTVVVEMGAFLTSRFFLSQGYDVTYIGYVVGLLCMYIAIFKYNLLNTGELAKDYLVDEMSESILAFDNEGQLIYSNRPARQMFPDIKTNPDPVINRIKDMVENQEVLTLGGRKYTALRNELFHSGRKVGVLYVLPDVTEQTNYLDELQKQRERADEANRAKTFFLANMSHEIRTPINAVLGMDEMILRESKEEDTRAYAADIMAAGHTLLSIINDILDFSKVEEGRMEIVPVQYVLSSMINDLNNMTRGRAKEKGIDFIVTVDRHIPHILYGDEIRIRQCALNFLSNAVKYTNEGRVTMEFTYEKKDEKSIYLTCTVKDTGIGIKESALEALFEPFTRIEEKKNRAIEGTGLGMTITKQLVELMNGTIKVESEYGKGSKFSFTLEQEVISWDEIGDYTGRLEEAKRSVYTDKFTAPDARILVVDDTAMNLTVMAGLLKKTKIKVDTAKSGREGLAMIEDNDYDVIFIDHMMPEMDGIEMLFKIKQMEEKWDIPTVALTANAVSGAREMYLDAGFTDYMSKPINGNDLQALLAHLLPEEKILKS